MLTVPEDAVRREASCLRGFAWAVLHALPAPEVIARLQTRGWAGSCLGGVLWTFVRDHHKVVFVPSTGRLQVRVDLATAFEHRRAVPEAVWLDLHSAPTRPS